jgi:hypothetical protein
MREFGKVLTAAEVAAVPTPSRPWVEPTDVVPVPTPEEMHNWFPNEEPGMRRFRWEVNVQTGERKAIELTLEEYRERHVGKIRSKNEYFQRKQAEAKKAARQALMDKLVDRMEADPGLIDRLARGI